MCNLKQYNKSNQDKSKTKKNKRFKVKVYQIFINAILYFLEKEAKVTMKEDIHAKKVILLF